MLANALLPSEFVNRDPIDMIAYRLLTGKDDASFCHKVTAALAAGWQLHGSPTITFNSTTGETVCGQAVTKDVPGQEYASDVKLGTL